MRIPESELILRPDGSIYHLGLRPEDMCQKIITVGDPKRVGKVSTFFDRVDFQSENREIVVHKGRFQGKEIMVISTGMGTDNIDIVLNELDALVNIDFETREIKKEHQSLHIHRIGTSGAIQDDIAVGDVLISDYGIGMDGLLHTYTSTSIRDLDFEKALHTQLPLSEASLQPYVVRGSKDLRETFERHYTKGNTLTLNGFYGPQGRILRLPLASPSLNAEYVKFNYNGHLITNLEMETAGIYGLSALLGHQAISINLILANRVKGTFLNAYEKPMNTLIGEVLELI